tara:strand:+ start:2119 stop:2592 length:474 start_codon:yes stop_codon:yes gene_type:complete
MGTFSNYNEIFDNYDFTEGGVREVDNNSLNWYDKKMKEIVGQYINGQISISPKLHRSIYNENLSYELTPTVFQHLKMMHCYSGGFNNNDYHRLPMLFRSKVYNFIKNESQTNTMKNFIAVSENLQKKYNFPEKFADAISWMWLYEPARKIIIEDANI